MRSPDFFVVGAAKSGTTALWSYFQKHPDIFVTQDISAKELGYYSNQYGINDKNSYLNFFKEANKNQLIGEVCHVYLTSTESADWIKKEVPNAQIIIILRNPVERAYSLYNWMVMHGYENETSFERALIKEDEILKGKYDTTKLTHTFMQNYYYFNSGLYYEQVKHYFDTFGKKNVLVLEYSEFVNNPEDILLRVFNFLKIESDKKIRLNNVNKSKRVVSVSLQFYLRRILLSKYKKYNYINAIVNLLMKVNTISKPPKKLSKTTKSRLIKKYSQNLQLLSNLCKFNFYKKWL